MITLRPFQFCDLAIKSEKDPGVKMNPDGSVRADWFVIATAARVGALIYLLDLYRAQIPFPEQVRVIVREHKFWKSQKVGIEDYAYQWSLGQAVWDKGIPAYPVKFPGDKVFRAQVTTPHFETGRVRLRGIMENGVLVVHPCLRRFVAEAGDFPFGDHDDTVDAVVGAVHMCMNEEIQGQTLVATRTPGFAVANFGRAGSRSGDPFDVFKSIY